MNFSASRVADRGIETSQPEIFLIQSCEGLFRNSFVRQSRHYNGTVIYMFIWG
jgi:hypothetical protein